MIELPCSDSLLPKKADFVDLFNQIAEIPTDLKMQINQYRAQIRSKVNDAEKKLKGLSLKEIEKGIDKEIGKAELQAIEEIESKIEELEGIMEDIADLLAPYWKKGKVRDWEKEAEDAIEELIQEYHIYIPLKMLELINKIIPISFEVPILGLTIDVLKITDPAYQEELVNQISGYTEEYFAKLEQLEADFKSGKLEQDAYDSAKGMLNDEAAKVLDAIYKLVPEELRYYDGEFGLVVNEYKAKLTWKYIKSEIMDWCTNTLHKMFTKLINDLESIGIKTLYTGGHGDFIDMLYGVDLIMDYKGKNYLVQVKNTEDQALKSAEYPRYRKLDYFAAPTNFGIIIKNKDGRITKLNQEGEVINDSE